MLATGHKRYRPQIDDRFQEAHRANRARSGRQICGMAVTAWNRAPCLRECNAQCIVLVSLWMDLPVMARLIPAYRRWPS
jgi:hypothetical protein